jgi:hypothetical protein
MEMIKRILRKILNVEVNEIEYDGIKASEHVKVYTSYYDSPSHHTLIWEDIYKVRQLINEGSEESVRILQRDYKMVDDGYSLKVTLRAPETYGSHNDKGYFTFYLNSIPKYYNEVLANKAARIQSEKEKIEKENEIKRRNEVKNLKQSLNKVANKK